VRDVALALEPLGGTLVASLARPEPTDASVRAYWLGQAGFVLAHGRTRVVVDPYLSDFLAKKYAGKELPHRRMAPPPIRAAELAGIDLVLCSHRHSDHMDPETLPALAAANRSAAIVWPRAERAHALAIGVPTDQLRTLDAGEELEVSGVVVRAIASAHEELTSRRRGALRLPRLCGAARGPHVVSLRRLRPVPGPRRARPAARRRRRAPAGERTRRLSREPRRARELHGPRAMDLCAAAGDRDPRRPPPWNVRVQHGGPGRGRARPGARLRGAALGVLARLDVALRFSRVDRARGDGPERLG